MIDRDIIDYLKTNLKIEVNVSGIELEVRLILDDVVISKDFVKLPGKDPYDD